MISRKGNCASHGKAVKPDACDIFFLFQIIYCAQQVISFKIACCCVAPFAFSKASEIKQKNIKIPILLIHAEKDSQIPASEAYLLHNANKKSELWIVKNADHGMSHSINPEEYEKRAIGFFKENLRMK